MLPTLNWLELSKIAPIYSDALTETFVESVIIPSRPHFESGYIKSEWAIKFGSRTKQITCVFCVKPKHTYLALYNKSTLKKAASASQSAFGILLSKTLTGLLFDSIEVIERERVATIWFKSKSSVKRIGLILFLIPPAPEAHIIEKSDGKIFVIASSRKTDELKLPDGTGAPPSPMIRDELLASPWTFGAKLSKELESEAFELRQRSITKVVNSQIKYLENKIRQSESALEESAKEPNWQKMGDLLKSVMHALPKPKITASTVEMYWEINDYESENVIHVPFDPKLTPGEQLEKFFYLEKRKRRRIKEATDRKEDATRQLTTARSLVEKKLEVFDWASLEKLEQLLVKQEKGTKQNEGDTGRVFTSTDGFLIHVGRTREENLELTFQIARGNDLWMHARGKPSAHVIIHIPPSKSVPLNTLLDAANLLIYFSSGSNWGKTEIDYTFRKFVKRIKDSSEVTYVNNKTLIVEMDEKRIKELLG